MNSHRFVQTNPDLTRILREVCGEAVLTLAIWPTFPVVMATRVLHAGATV
jgi:hypothetical protein